MSVNLAKVTKMTAPYKQLFATTKRIKPR